jgi:hypothetical protein
MGPPLKKSSFYHQPNSIYAGGTPVGGVGLPSYHASQTPTGVGANLRPQSSIMIEPQGQPGNMGMPNRVDSILGQRSHLQMQQMNSNAHDMSPNANAPRHMDDFDKFRPPIKRSRNNDGQDDSDEESDAELFDAKEEPQAEADGDSNKDQVAPESDADNEA